MADPTTTTPATPDQHATQAAPQGVEVFSFGDAEPALNQTIYDYVGIYTSGSYYEPPISWEGLAKSLGASPHHASAIALKRNLLTRLMKPSKVIKRQDLAGVLFDFLTFGNCFWERVDSVTGKPLQLRQAMAMFTRPGVDDGAFWKLPGGAQDLLGYGSGIGQASEFKAGSVCHIMEPDVKQNVFGAPDYLSALQAAWLNEAATLFRRRYYVNGTHAGYILYITDPLHEQLDVEELKTKMKESKGPGNFRNLLLYAPGGKGDGKGIQLIHTSEAAAKDEFLRIKSVTRDDVLAAHRTPPQLLGLVPENSAGFGSAREAMGVFYELEALPLQQKMLALNEWFGEEVLQFERPAWADLEAAASGAPPKLK